MLSPTPYPGLGADAIAGPQTSCSTHRPNVLGMTVGRLALGRLGRVALIIAVLALPRGAHVVAAGTATVAPVLCPGCFLPHASLNGTYLEHAYFGRDRAGHPTNLA